ncbi:hypothetical protein IC582_006940 [Cucumis melo]
MKSMAAFRQQSKAFIFLKLTKANRAIRAFNQPISSLVLANSNGLDKCFIQASCGNMPWLMKCWVVIIFVFLTWVIVSSSRQTVCVATIL